MFVGTDLHGEVGGDSNQREVLLLLPSREPLGSSPRKKACSGFGEPTGWCTGRARSQGGFLEEVSLEGAPGGQLFRFLQTGLQNHFSQACRLLCGSPAAGISWEVLGQAVKTLGEEGGVQSCLSFPHLDRNQPQRPLILGMPLERERRAVDEEAGLKSRPECVTSAVCPQTSPFAACTSVSSSVKRG